MSKSKFIGEAGEHYVAYKLASKEFYVGLTLGNMPHIDLFVSSDQGLRSITIQVKSSKGAYRKSRYKHEGYEWDVNTKVIGRHSTDFWYAFVDFKWKMEEEPDVYIVPSLWVADFVKKDFTRKLYFLPKAAADEARNNWDRIKKALDKDEALMKLATTWDEDLLIRWR